MDLMKTMFLFSFITVSAGSKIYFRAYQDVTLKNTISNSPPLISSKSTSITGCTSHCMNDREESCGSIFFHEENGSCVIYVSRMAGVNSVIGENGWKFYHGNQGE